MAEVKPHALSFKRARQEECLVASYDASFGHALKCAGHTIYDGIYRVIECLTVLRYPFHFFRDNDGKSCGDVISGNDVEGFCQRDLKPNVHDPEYIDELIGLVPRVFNQGSKSTILEECHEVLHDRLAPSFHAASVHVEEESLAVSLSVLDSGQGLEKLILQGPDSTEAGNMELYSTSKDRRLRRAHVDVWEIDDIAWVQDGLKSLEALSVVRDNLDTFCRTSPDPFDCNALQGQEWDMGVQMDAPFHFGMKPLQDIELGWHNPQSFDDDEIRLKLRDLAVNIVVVDTLYDTGFDPLFRERLYDKASRVPQATGALAV